MAKRLMVLVGILAVLLATAVPAMAQEQQVTATGTLGTFAEVFQVDTSTTKCAGQTCPPYGIIDAASGKGYGLYSDRNLNPYVGQNVTVSGTVQLEGFEGGPTLLDVSGITPPGGSDEEITVSFTLTVEGEPPTGTTFFGGVGQQPVGLTDPDGDGTYTGTLTLPPDFGAFPIPVAIIAGDPANPQQTIKSFGEVVIEDGDTFSASVSYKDGASGNNGSGNTGSRESGNSGSGSSGSSSGSASSGSGSSGSNKSNPAGGSSSGGSGGEAKVGGAKGKELPKTGGDTLPALGLIGALLVGGGLLVRHATR